MPYPDNPLWFAGVPGGSAAGCRRPAEEAGAGIAGPPCDCGETGVQRPECWVNILVADPTLTFTANRPRRARPRFRQENWFQ
jgi:hypothetical protein